MAQSTSSTRPPSGSSTPNPRFTAQNTTAEDLLKEQTVGLVHLSDFRKRRAEAQELKERETQGSGASTPVNIEIAVKPVKKKRKTTKKGGLSFADDEDAGHGVTASSVQVTRSNTPDAQTASNAPTPSGDEEEGAPVKKRLAANATVGPVPKCMSKSALLRETQFKEQLRKEFLAMQEAVKETEFLLPFVFYEGKDIPGGACRVKKGDMVWVFLDRARKVGAEKGVGGSEKSRREWARVGVDDLMLVRGDLIIPHHYTFYYFMLNNTVGYDGTMFAHSAEQTSSTPTAISAVSTPPAPSTPGGLSVPDPMTKANRSRAQTPLVAESELEGYDDDPSLTKVVDRRWYEKNKHIFPASTWEDFNPEKIYSSGSRRDGEGNAFFLR